MRKGKVIIFVLDAKQNFLNLKKNMKVEVDGHLFLKHYLMYLKLKLILWLGHPEQNIIVKNVEVITDIYLMTDLNLLAKDIATMEPV